MDALLLARLARELDRLWRGAWVQQAWHEPGGPLVLKLRRPGEGAATTYLLLNAVPPGQGLGLVAARPRGGSGSSAVARYARAHLVGTRLASAACLPYERVARFAFGGPCGERSAVLEATGRSGNLVLLDGEGRQRAACSWKAGAPGEPYAGPPAPPGALRLDEVGREELEAWLAADEPLTRRVRGLSALLAAELVHRGRTGEAWSVYREWLDASQGPEAPVFEYPRGLSAVRLAHLGEGRPVSAPLERAGELLVAARAEVRERDRARERETRERSWRVKLERRIARVRADLEAVADPEVLRRRGDVLAAGLSRVPRGVERVRLPDVWAEGGGEVELELDAALSPSQNLERLYRAAAKAQRAGAFLAERLAAAEAELDGGFREEPPRAAWAAERPGLSFLRFASSDGLAIWVGRNGPENDRLLREARPWDLWLHVRDAAGAHVLVRRGGPGQRVPERTLAEAAGLAAKHSRRAAEAWVDVMVLDAARVRKLPGAAPGKVQVSGERTVRIRPGAGQPRPAGARP